MSGSPLITFFESAKKVALEGSNPRLYEWKISYLPVCFHYVKQTFLKGNAHIIYPNFQLHLYKSNRSWWYTNLASFGVVLGRTKWSICAYYGTYPTGWWRMFRRLGSELLSDCQSVSKNRKLEKIWRKKIDFLNFFWKIWNKKYWFCFYIFEKIENFDFWKICDKKLKIWFFKIFVDWKNWFFYLFKNSHS